MSVEYILDPQGILMMNFHRGDYYYMIKIEEKPICIDDINVPGRVAFISKIDQCRMEEIWKCLIKQTESGMTLKSNNQVVWMVKACLQETKTLEDFYLYFERMTKALCSEFKREEDSIAYCKKLHETFLMQGNPKDFFMLKKRIHLSCGHWVDEDIIYYKIQGKSCCKECYIEKGFDPDE